MKEIFDVEGMTCSACSAAVEKSVSKLDGVDNVSVNLITNTMQVEYQDSLDRAKIISAVEDAGYSASVQAKDEPVKEEKKESSLEIQAKNLKSRFIISLIFMVPLMYIAMGGMVGLPVPSIFEGAENAIVFAMAQMVLTMPVMYVNRAYYQSGFRTLFKGNPNMDSLIALGSSAAFISGVYVIFRMGYAMGHGDMELVHQFMHNLYFESAAMILTLITLGKFLEARAKTKSTDAVKALMDLSPKTAIKIVDGKNIEVPIEDVKVSDLVLVKPGSAIPIDGTIVEGSASIDESAITGESIPVERTEGDEVIGSTILNTGSIVVRAEKVGEETSLAQIIELVKEANATKPPIAKMADKIAGVFVPFVIVIAVLATVIWTIFGDSFDFALNIGISVLVISCPCALGLATPLSIMVGTGLGAKNGVLIKSSEALETLHEVDAVLLDKTGTITEGKPSVTDIVTSMDEKDFLTIAGSIEKPSEHPLSTAIVSYCESESVDFVDVSDFENITGKGIHAKIGSSDYYAGNIAFMKDLGVELLSYKGHAEELSSQAKTAMYFADKDKVIGIIAVSDRVKESSQLAVDKFHDQGLDVYMITGDNEKTARAIATELGIDKLYAEVLPEDKDSIVRKIQDQDKKVAMVGDGINDAPALARADVGIAIGAGTDVAIESADIVLVKSSLLDVVNAISLSKATIKNIKQNLFWAFFYNIILIPVAAGVLYPAFEIVLNPIIASAAMAFSSLFVVTNALRLYGFKPEISNEVIEEGSKDDASAKKVNFTQVKEEVGENKTIDNKTIDKGDENKMRDLTVKIEGMSCEHCQKRVEEALNKIDGVKAKVDLENAEAKVSAEEGVTDDSIKEAVKEAGYEVTGIK